ncbi:Hsp20/alpha crystallin family protein [Fundidesulfovibrio terrae]|uniref:Hsp20/alpha crystallin family protein n=1 Tax=Fundidesulfovibrio terrae TaxID=2922866 RepID=UPI001FAF493F|nr:Hsp20/alpha crystallin family protein [Fundidesulfovibrio terrae]
MVIDFSPFFGQQTPLDRIFEAFWSPNMAISQRPYSYPPVNISEDEERIVVRCEIPGMDISELDLTLTESSLVVKGERQAAKGKYYRQERPTGAFQRVVNIHAPIDRDKVTAKMKDGLLEVVIPKSEASKPKKISIDIA